MGKQKNHKKRLKLKMKHQGLLKNSLNKVEEGLKQLNQQAKKVKEEVIERGQEVFEDLKPKKGSHSLDDFTNLPEVAGIRSNLVETLYHEGITSAEDFKSWTKESLLEINGIGPATVEKLAENGAKFKK